ncbi:MAG: hypothetical protein Q9197_001623 [Variospora fuerteventurae]
MPPTRTNRTALPYSPFQPHLYHAPYPSIFPLVSSTGEFRRGSRRYTIARAILPPSTSDPCRHPSCPLPFPHSRGLYLHLNQASTVEAGPHANFGASNPPPELWAARERCLRRRARDGDWHLVNGFVAAHFVAWGEGEVGKDLDEKRMRWAMEMIRMEREESSEKKKEKDREEEKKKKKKKKKRDKDMKALVAGMGVVGIGGDDDDDDTRAQRSRAPSPVDEEGEERRELERVLERDLEEAWLKLEVERTEEAVERLGIKDE